MAAPEEEIAVFPDVARAVDAFDALGTQWRTGFAGFTGLDYSAVEPTLRLLGVERSEWKQLFEDIRVMEAAALAQMHEDREDDLPAK